MLKSFHQPGILEAGCDEAGRGCIAGPVFAAAVILPEGFAHPKLNDSKKLTSKSRDLLRPVIETNAIAFGVGVVSEQEIDEINILNASFLAMHRAIERLGTPPGHLLIDGNKFKPYREIAYTCIVGGDSKYASIAAASVLAKTYRDQHMLMLHREYPGYSWKNNKGYPTREHRSAVADLGPSPYHRRSFRLLDQQMQLDFS